MMLWHTCPVPDRAIRLWQSKSYSIALLMGRSPFKEKAMS